MKFSRFRAKDLRNMIIIIAAIAAAVIVVGIVVFGKVIPDRVAARKMAREEQQISEDMDTLSGDEEKEETGSEEDSSQTEDSSQEEDASQAEDVTTDTEEQSEPVNTKNHEINTNTTNSPEEAGISVSASQTVYKMNLVNRDTCFETFTSNNSKFYGDYASSQMYTNVEIQRDNPDDFKLVFSADEGSGLTYEFGTITSKDLQSYKNSVSSSFNSNYSNVEVMSDTSDAEYCKFYAKGNDGDITIYDLFTVYSGGYFCRMILKYPNPTDDEDRIYKEYYAEYLYRSCGFSMSAEEPRGFQDFQKAQ